MLLHLMPILTERGDAVNEVILTHISEVRQAVLIMRTVIRQCSSSRIGETVGSVRPWERVRINRVFGTGQAEALILFVVCAIVGITQVYIGRKGEVSA